jgi:hypothetical protein
MECFIISGTGGKSAFNDMMDMLSDWCSFHLSLNEQFVQKFKGSGNDWRVAPSHEKYITPLSLYIEEKCVIDVSYFAGEEFNSLIENKDLGSELSMGTARWIRRITQDMIGAMTKSANKK